MIRLDLHVHSQRSKDAKGSIMELAQACKAKGLHGFAITDHDACNDQAEIAAAMEATGQIIISGCESSTVEGHLLCLGITEAPPRGGSVDSTVDFVEKQGGVCIPAHPLKVMSGFGPTQVLAHWNAGRFVASEGVNGRERRLVQDNTLLWLQRQGIPSTGGTDAHWVRDIGTAWTWFQDNVDSVDTALAALKAGECQGDGGNLKRRSVWSHGMSLPARKLARRIKKTKE